jgi:hypothetical protein
MEGFSYLKTVRTKTQTVFLPFLLWNTAFFIAVLVMLSAGVGDGYVPGLWNMSARDLLTQLFATEDFPVNIPLYFLRDLFVCILLSPLLAWLIRRIPLLTLSALFLLAIVPEMSFYVVLKRSILFSFSFGIYASLYKIDIKALDRYAPVGAACNRDLHDRTITSRLGSAFPKYTGNCRCGGLLDDVGPAHQDQHRPASIEDRQPELLDILCPLSPARPSVDGMG